MAYITEVLSIVVNELFKSYWVEALCWSGLCILLAICFRKLAEHKENLRKRLTTFSIKQCALHEERDRSMVYACIATLVRASGHATEGANEEECLQAFDALVRDEMPGSFLAMFGRFGFSSKHLVAVNMLIWMPRAIDGLASIEETGWHLWFRQYLAFLLVWSTVVVPLSLVVVSTVANWKVEWRGVRKQLLLIASVVAGGAVCAIGRIAHRTLFKHFSSQLFTAFYFVFILLAHCIVLAVMSRSPGSKVARCKSSFYCSSSGSNATSPTGSINSTNSSSRSSGSGVWDLSLSQLLPRTWRPNNSSGKRHGDSSSQI
eukprot:CAMPEP_0206466758 /NCGR_PEP_ID=MMETSP0324_2-20121206/28647_1 /ASSEMBLY_ACC=CAM_ASM_000836 /TAXON_ID=2866 /ORGANISM="Crypthecodinium cohnii, Strain Seligo" /LENGTH=316 /DNA_ID=CAMNT_0053939931 /DNA_START=138 /DNA_END=1089 /DNA_ORIENTATION=+